MDRVAALLGLAVLVFCVATWIGLLSAYGVQVPRGDQFDTPGRQIRALSSGTLDLEALVAQHNESRKLIPNAISLSIYQLRGFYDVRAELFVGHLLGVLAAVGIALLGWLSTGSVASSAVITAWFASLLWSAHTWEFHLFPVTFERYLPQVFLLAMLLVFLRFGLRWWTVLFASLACVASQFSYASGVALWPLLAVFLVLVWAKEGRRVVPMAAVALGVAAASFWLYFHDYSRPANHTPLVAVFAQRPADMLFFVLRFLGNGVTSSHELLTVILGALALAAFIALAGRSLLSGASGRERAALAAWITVGLYSLAQACLSLIGRLPMGMSHATRTDYVTHPIYLYTAIAALLLMATHEAARRLVLCLLLAAAVALSFTLTKPSTHRQLRGHERILSYARSCYLLARLHEDEACLDPLYPRGPHRRDVFESMASHLPVDMLRVWHEGAAADGQVLRMVERDEITLVAGLARLPESDAGAVVAALPGSSSPQIVAVAPIGVGHPDAPHDEAGRVLPDGWVMELRLPEEPDPCALRFYAMDNDTGVLRPIAADGLPGCVLH